MTRTLSFAVALLLLVATGSGARGDEEERLPAFVVFNFLSNFDDNAMGDRVAYMLRFKLRRLEKFDVVAQMIVEDEAPGFRPAPDENPEQIAQLARAKFYATYAMWGEVTSAGGGYDVAVRVIEVEGDEAPVVLSETVHAEEPRALVARMQEIADRLSNYDRTGDIVLGQEPYTNEGPNLVANGDLEEWAGESPDDGPAGWERPNGLTTFWEDAGPPHGRILRTHTDVYLSQWELWYPLWKGGAPAGEAPERIPTSGPKYDTVGGTCGAWFFSDWIPVESGQLYKVSFDMKGRWIDGPIVFVAKVFVKGYAPFEDQRREVFRAYKACRTETQGREWEHFERTFHPTRRTSSVQWIRIKVFTYWPVDNYYFDNFAVHKVW